MFRSPVRPPKTSYPSTEAEVDSVKAWATTLSTMKPGTLVGLRHATPPAGYTVEQFLEDVVAFGPVLMTRSYERDSPLVKAIVDRADEFLVQLRSGIRE